MIRVVLVDDQEMLRAGLRAIIGAHPELEVVAEAGDGLAVLRMLDDARPDVVLMDLHMSDTNGLEGIRTLAAELPSAACLVLTMVENDDTVAARSVRVRAATC